MSSSPARVLVVGSGAAGVMTAQGLRRRGFEGEIALIGEEPAHSYDRPPLSKQVLSGAWEPGKAVLMPAARIDDLGIDFRQPLRATGLDVEGRTVTTDDGGEHAYDELVIATGVRPRTLPSLGERAHVLRTMEDAAGLRAALDGARHLAIVGGGFLGLEVAATARKLGAEVTVIEPLAEPLAGRLTIPVAERLLALHRANGVDLRTGVGVNEMAGERLALSDGTALDTDAVLVAIGCEPAVEWLEGSGLAIEDGVLCDEYCQAAAHVWAAGDVARWHHRGLERSLRVEHRMNANEQGATVAANILGAGQAFTPIPFFWTDHYDVKIQVWGVLPPGIEPVLAEGELDGDRFVLTTSDPGSGHVVGAIGWNSARSMVAYRAVIAENWSTGANERIEVG
jgi:3-phenylpropionate/trans-cinnamate dioxygenase ferredoxin reductase subunit